MKKIGFYFDSGGFKDDIIYVKTGLLDYQENGRFIIGNEDYVLDKWMKRFGIIYKGHNEEPYIVDDETFAAMLLTATKMLNKR